MLAVSQAEMKRLSTRKPEPSLYKLPRKYEVLESGVSSDYGNLTESQMQQTTERAQWVMLSISLTAGFI